MTGSSEKKNFFWTVAISISLLGIIGIGYVFDPEAEIFQEMTGLKLNYMNSSSTRAVANPTDISLISDPINSPVEDSHPGSNNMEDLGVAEDIILEAAILEEQDENESTDPELITEDKKEKPSKAENYDTIKEEKTDAMNEEKTISEDIIKDADAFDEDNSPDGDSIEEAEIIDEDITFNSDNGVANDMGDEETDTVHRFQMYHLSEAIAKINVDLVREILIANPEYSLATDENGWTALHEAVRTGDLSVVKILVEEGKADINARTGINGDGESVFELALHFLQSYEHPVARYLEHMIRQEIEKSQIESNEFKMSDLSKAVATRDVDLIRGILTANPEYIRARDENGWTVLHEAVRYGDLPTVAVLVEEGKADINARTGINGDEESVLSLALFFLQSREHPVVRYLDDIGAKINPEQYDGDTELLALREAFLHNDVNRFEDILKGRPELSNVKDENGWTILHEAARFGNVDMATILVQIGNADVNSRTGENSDGGSPLYYALLDQRPMDHPIVEFLFSQDGMVIAPGQSEDEL